MKQVLRMAIISLFTIFLMTACGTDNGNNEDTWAGNDTENSEAENDTPDNNGNDNTANKESADGMRTFTDVTGNDVEIPENPERIVTTQYVSQLLALDITPAGAPEHHLTGDYLDNQEEGIEDIGNPINLEIILELEPDLIIAHEPEDFEQLSQIAPTVIVPWLYGDVFEQFNEVARIVMKEDEASAWIEAYEAKAAEGREEVNVDNDEIISIFLARERDTLRIYGARNIGHVIYRSLELTPPDIVQEHIEEDPDFEEFTANDISMEMLPEYAGDRIIMFVQDEEAREEGGMFHQIEESTLWQNLDAVQNDNVYFIEMDPWFHYNPLAIDRALDEAIEMFSE